VSADNRLDAFQRRHAWVGFPIAVVYKVVDDRAPYLAALVTYYAFVSLFPLLLVFLAATGFFLDGHPGVRDRLLTAALQDLPVVGDQLRHSIRGFHGSGAALAVGIVGALYGGLGAMQAAQTAFNAIYGVPRNSQPNPLRSRVRSLLLVALLGTGVLLTTGINALNSTSAAFAAELGTSVHLGAYALSLGINVALFTIAFQVLTARDLRVRHVLVGGLLAGGVWTLLQVFGPRYVAHEAGRGATLYGVFGVVLAAIAWLYLQSFAIMLAAEVNVVLHYRLWPRALLTPFTDDVSLTAADRRAYAMYARSQRFKGFERIRADFGAAYPVEPGRDAGADDTAVREGVS
jgi:YihY family inner membrane protein